MEAAEQICIVHSESCGRESFVYLNDLDKHHTQKDAEYVLTKIQIIKHKRLQEKPGSSSRLEDECRNVPEVIGSNHGYHKDCYRRFTKHSERLKGEEPPQKRQKVETRSTGNEWNDGILFHQDCIFCNKTTSRYVKNGNVWKKEYLSKFDKGGGKLIEDICKAHIGEEKYDNLLRRINGVCLFSKEAVFHESCRRAFQNEARDPSLWKSKNEETRNLQARKEEAHHQTFLRVQDVIDKDICAEKQVLKVTDLLNVYTDYLRQTEFRNDGYRSEKLKKKILAIEKYNSQVGFTRLVKVSKFSSYMIYCKTTPIDELIKCSYELGTRDIVKEIAMSSRSSILEKHKKSPEMPWPITPETLQTINPVPDDSISASM